MGEPRSGLKYCLESGLRFFFDFFKENDALQIRGRFDQEGKQGAS
jgi:hypothetical protein